MKLCALVFGIVFTGLGLIAGSADYYKDGLLLGVFEMNHLLSTAFLITGTVGLVAAIHGILARLYFCLVGIFLGIVGLLGFIYAGDVYYTHLNMADMLLISIAAVVALYLGFIFKSGARI